MSNETEQNINDRFAVEMRAAQELRKAQSWPTEPDELVAARKGLDDLVGRKGWDDLNRDDRRLRTKYQATIDAFKVSTVQHAHALGLLDDEYVAAAHRLGLLQSE